MRTPNPFEPLWEVKRGDVIERGKGLLPGSRDDIQHFQVLLGYYRIKVEPMAGTISLDSNVAMTLGRQSKLLWFRRMQMMIATHDTNATMAPDCLWYGIGLEGSGQRVGYQLYEDGNLKMSVI